jgi:uncharacterized OsmC-like protein
MAKHVRLREIQAPLRARYQSDPSAALIETGAHTVTTDPNDPFLSRVTFPHQPGRVIDAGIHAAVGGTGELPCSGDVLCAALAICEETTIKAVANHLGFELESIDVEVTSQSDIRPTLGLDAASAAGRIGMRVHSSVRFVAGTDPARAERMMHVVERYCAVLGALRQPQEVESTFTIVSGNL